MKLILWFCLVLNFAAYAQVEIPEETFLLQSCGKQDLLACEKLGAYYLSKSEWEKANMIGDALCKKDLAMGCTFAGSALMSLGKLKEANVYLMQACDKFESLGCRSLGRLMNKAGEKALANMYFKRACFYGLKEICGEVKDSKQWYSSAALTLLDTINRDCRDSQAADCNTDFSIIKTCAAPLTKQDCLLLAGQLSIYFRAKFLQSEAKLTLLTLYTAEKSLKEEAKPSSYSYDLSRVLKHVKPLEKYHYIFGFMKGCGKKFVRSRRAHVYSQGLYPRAYRHLGSRTTANIISFFSKRGAENDCYDPKIGYEAYAVRSLDPLNPTRLDVWKIDQDKRIENVVDGLPLP